MHSSRRLVSHGLKRSKTASRLRGTMDSRNHVDRGSGLLWTLASCSVGGPWTIRCCDACQVVNLDPVAQQKPLMSCCCCWPFFHRKCSTIWSLSGLSCRPSTWRKFPINRAIPLYYATNIHAYIHQVLGDCHYVAKPELNANQPASVRVCSRSRTCHSWSVPAAKYNLRKCVIVSVQYQTS